MIQHIAEQLQSGDEIYWNDPDDGLCSRHYIIREIEVYPCGSFSLVGIDGDALEGFIDELE